MGNCLVSLGRGMLGGKVMGDLCLACGGDGRWRFSGRRMWLVVCFGPFPILPVPLLSLVFPIPLGPIVSLPFFPYFLRTPYLPQ